MAATLIAAGWFGTTALGAPTPIDAFARMPAVHAPTISPDGRYIALLSGMGDQRVLIVHERDKNKSATVLGTTTRHAFDFNWCGWANESRILCGVVGMESTAQNRPSTGTHVIEQGFTYAITRLVALNADGSDFKVLFQGRRGEAAQFQDSILDWTADERDTVLIALDDDRNSLPSVFELNVYTGGLRMRVGEESPLREFWTDSQGQVRLARGYTGTQIGYFARLRNGDAVESKWQPIAKYTAFTQPDDMLPIGIKPETNQAYVIAPKDGRDALWLMDMAEQEAPQLLFADPQVDVNAPVFSKSGRMVGVFYETDRPHAFYTDKRAKSVIDGVSQFLTDSYNEIEDSTLDNKVYVIRSSSDVDAGTYAVLDVGAGKGELVPLGSAYPELARVPQGRMKSIAYPAEDGVQIPGYLTVPHGAEAKHLPLIVMPHGGPIARDRWEFDFLRSFLVDRGYAVLQMNFRGSDGFGREWFRAAHQDWGGLTYSDITDGAKWAVAQGIADPKRMCIVGWSFGGYAALLGAVRNGDLYRCAVSIAGVSDLFELRMDAGNFVSKDIRRLQVGSDRDKLREDSPRRHADKVNIPVLLVHGDSDAQVEADHSRKMAQALKSAGKPHQLVMIRKADHQLRWQSDRVTLLENLEKFLAANLR